LPLALATGAALTRIPAGVVAEAATSGTVPEQILANHREVLNVLGQLLNGLHVALGDVLVSPKQGAVAITSKPESSLDMELSVAGHGTSGMSFQAL
jgi:hypothetical protein